MKHLIVGTAGHVDHGKTALVKCLTGTDTDRLKEEKRRGISIELGFAALRFADDITLGIVDVPGHERFLKNMLAGTGGIDLALLVIAADEGIMPQTREHFAMLECFGVRRGLVAITKTDKVDEEWLELVEGEVRELLADTFMAGAKICRVSSVTGSGVEELKAALQQAAASLSARDRKAPFRLWIDRAFHLKGQGLAVTGSVLSGTLKLGDEVLLEPAGRLVRIRGIESHNEAIKEVGAGQRASLNLTGVSLAEVERGMLLREVGYGQKSCAWEALVRWKQPYPSGTRIRFHLGASEFFGRLIRPRPSETSEELIRLQLEAPAAAGPGDAGLLRRYSPQNLIGGILLIRPFERSSRKQEQLQDLAGQLRKNDQTGVMLALLALAKTPLTLTEWKSQAGFANKEAVECSIKTLTASGRVRQVGAHFLTAAALAEIQAKLCELLLAHHQGKPGEAGLATEILRQRLQLPAPVADRIFADAAQAGLIRLEAELASLPSHAAKHGRATEDLLQAFLAVAPVTEAVDLTPQWLAEKMQLTAGESKQFFDTLLRQKIIVRLTGVHVYRKTIQYIGEAIHQHFQRKPTLSVGEFRDMIQASRRLAIPLLEYYDAHKYTVRKGDERLAGPSVMNLSE